MKILIFITLFLIVGCSHPTYRSIASFDSQEVVLGEAEISKSSIKQFPSEKNGHTYRYYFFVKLRNSEGEFVDVKNKEFVIKAGDELIPFKVERILTGRYYLIIEKTSELPSSQLSFYVQGKRLDKDFSLNLAEADSQHSSIKITSKSRNKIKLVLTLLDSHQRPLEMPGEPELILEGNGLIEGMKYLQGGKWEFSLLYPDENQIVYISVRAQSAYFKDFFRFHHVER